MSSPATALAAHPKHAAAPGTPPQPVLGTALSAHVRALSTAAGHGDFGGCGQEEVVRWCPDHDRATAQLIRAELAFTGQAKPLPAAAGAAVREPGAALHELLAQHRGTAEDALAFLRNQQPSPQFPSLAGVATWWHCAEDRLRCVEELARMTGFDAGARPISELLGALGDRLGQHHRLLAVLLAPPPPPPTMPVRAASIPVSPALIALGALPDIEHRTTPPMTATGTIAVPAGGPWLAARARALAAHGHAQRAHGHSRPALGSHSWALMLAAQSHRPATIALCRAALAAALAEQGEKVEAAQMLGHAAAELRDCQDSVGAGLLLIAQADLHYQCGDADNALAIAWEAVTTLHNAPLAVRLIDAWQQYLVIAAAFQPALANHYFQAAALACHDAGLPDRIPVLRAIVTGPRS